MKGCPRWFRTWSLLAIALPGLLVGGGAARVMGAPKRPAPVAPKAPAPVVPKGPSRVTLAPGTPVQVQAKAEVSSRSAQAGEAVSLVVSSPVQQGGSTLIAAGAEVRGTVVQAVPATSSHPGGLLVAVDAVQAVEGTWIPLRAVSKPQDAGDLVLPSSACTLAAGPAGAPREAVLVPSRRLECWTDSTCSFVLTPPERAGTPPVVSRVGDPPVRSVERGPLVRLKQGTRIRVRPLKDISAKRVRAGERVDFVVSSAVEADAQVVVPEGALARGTVLWARSLGVAGTRSELVVAVERVETWDGARLAVVPAAMGSIQGTARGTVPLVALVATDREVVLSRTGVHDLLVDEERWFAPGGRARKGAPAIRALALPGDGGTPTGTDASGRLPVVEAFQVGREVSEAGEPRGVATAFSRVSQLSAWLSLEPASEARALVVTWFRNGLPQPQPDPLVVKAGESRGWTTLSLPGGELMPPGRWVVVLQWRGQILDVQAFTVGG